MSSNTNQQLLKLTQVARMLGVSPWTLRKWDNEGKLKAVRIGSGKHRRYKKEDVLDVVNQGI